MDKGPDIVGSVQRLYRTQTEADEYFLSEATDTGSGFDVGSFFTVPDSGRNRTELRHAIFSSLMDPGVWQNLTDDELSVGGANGKAKSRLSSEVLRDLKKMGANTHHMGLVDEKTGKISADHIETSSTLVRAYPVVLPTHFSYKGRPAWDYHEYHLAQKKLIALEHIFRLGSPQGSSILQRYEKAAASSPKAAHDLLGDLGLETPIVPWAHFETLLYDSSTKYEDHDRSLKFQEIVHIAGIGHELFENVIDVLELSTLLVNALFARHGFVLWDIKWEAAIDNEKVVIVDTLDHDSIRITSETKVNEETCYVHFNKQAIRDYYRILEKVWIEALDDAKSVAEHHPTALTFRQVYDQGVLDGTYPPIPPLDPVFGDIQSEKYNLVAGAMSGRLLTISNSIDQVVKSEITYYETRQAKNEFLSRISG